MRKFSMLMALFLALMVAIVAPSHASVGIWEDGSPVGVATDIEFTGAVTTDNGSRWTFPLVLAGTGNGGATTMVTTDTAVSPSYALVRKALGVQVGLAGTLADGSPGQILTIRITERAGSGTFVLVPTTTTNFYSLTFDAVNEYATLLYSDDTTGWIILSTNATIAQY